MRRVAILLLPVLLCAGFLAACGSGSDHRARTLTIRPVTINGHTVTRVVIPATVATTEPDSP